MMLEEDFERDSENNSCNQKKSLKRRQSVTFADIPTEPHSKTKDNESPKFPSKYRKHIIGEVSHSK